MCERHAERQDADNFRAFTIAAEVRNTLRSKDSHKLWEAKDFFTPSVAQKQKMVKPTESYMKMFGSMLQDLSLNQLPKI